MIPAASRAIALAAVLSVPIGRQVRDADPRLAQGSAPTLELVGLAGQHRSINAAEFARLPHVQATVSAHNVQGHYSGVPLGDVMRLVDRPAGEALRGPALAAAVVAEASDGYRVLFAPSEIDSGFTNKLIFVADRKNGAPLDSAEGPWRIIVPDEKRPARWAKKVVRLRLVAVP